MCGSLPVEFDFSVYMSGITPEQQKNTKVDVPYMVCLLYMVQDKKGNKKVILGFLPAVTLTPIKTCYILVYF